MDGVGVRVVVRVNRLFCDKKDAMVRVLGLHGLRVRKGAVGMNFTVAIIIF